MSSHGPDDSRLERLEAPLESEATTSVAQEPVPAMGIIRAVAFHDGVAAGPLPLRSADGSAARVPHAHWDDDPLLERRYRGGSEPRGMVCGELGVPTAQCCGVGGERVGSPQCAREHRGVRFGLASGSPTRRRGPCGDGARPQPRGPRRPLPGRRPPVSLRQSLQALSGQRL